VDWDGGVKLIVGLGNPGIEYQFTPHTWAFWRLIESPEAWEWM